MQPFARKSKNTTVAVAGNISLSNTTYLYGCNLKKNLEHKTALRGVKNTHVCRELYGSKTAGTPAVKMSLGPKLNLAGDSYEDTRQWISVARRSRRRDQIIYLLSVASSILTVCMCNLVVFGLVCAPKISPVYGDVMRHKDMWGPPSRD